MNSCVDRLEIRYDVDEDGSCKRGIKLRDDIQAQIGRRVEIRVGYYIENENTFGLYF